MKQTLQTVRKALGDKLIGKPYMQEMVCSSLLKLPPELTKRISKTVWFISSPVDAWAFTFRGEEIKDRHLVFLSEELFQEAPSQIMFTILHEIGHVVLNHRNSIGNQQTQSEIKKQEQEADIFAKKYLSEQT